MNVYRLLNGDQHRPNQDSTVHFERMVYSNISLHLVRVDLLIAYLCSGKHRKQNSIRLIHLERSELGHGEGREKEFLVLNLIQKILSSERTKLFLFRRDQVMKQEDEMEEETYPLLFSELKRKQMESSLILFLIN